MKVEILSRELIKPYTPTPPSFRNYNISLMDELAPNMNVPTIFYYSASDQDTNHDVTLRYKHLKNSLSKVLTSFYPFAGRYRVDSHSVDCGDQGAEYVEAKVDIRLDDLVSQRMNVKAELLNGLVPCPIGAIDGCDDPLLAIQVSAFSCGGVAITVCSSHRIADMSSTMSFVNAWAISAKQELGDKENIEVHKIVTKMFHFDKSKISSIRERARLDDSSLLPSRVQSISGLIGKAIIDVHVANPDNPNSYTIIEAVNIRKRTVPPLPNHQFGNLYILSCVQSVVGPERVVGLGSLVNCLSESVKGVVDACRTVLSHGKERETMISHGVYKLMNSFSDPNMFFAASFTSWSKFPFYEADFGWGKPVWFSIPNIPMKNNVVLIDDKSGEGIEAWVCLEENYMKNFKQHTDIADVICAL
ncbi:hypothetical protein AgCh_024074 [Apium graveolens]